MSRRSQGTPKPQLGILIARDCERAALAALLDDARPRGGTSRVETLAVESLFAWK
jgi:hypothetical protein